MDDIREAEIPLRNDSEFGLTVEQFRAMPARLRKQIDRLDPDEDAEEIARLKGDIGIWERAAKQLEGKDGKWSIVWTKLREAEAIYSEYGARNSKSDAGRIQAAHDALVELGASCGAVHESATREVMVDRSGTPEVVAFAESGPGSEMVTLAEAGATFDDANRELWITPIRPGPGNPRDNYYYPAPALREAVEKGVFNNRKMFANHPRKSDEKDLPERDVKDWVGVVKETVWDDRRGVPRSRIRVLDDAVYEKWKAAPEHIAFSVLGQGAARTGRVDGAQKRIVESIKNIRSIDWVTEAGAGGAIDFAESAYEELEMELSNLTVEQLREARPDLIAAIREEDDEAADAADADDDADADAEDADAAGDDGDEPEVTATVKGGGGGKASAEAPAPDGYVSREEFEALRQKLVEQEVKEAAAAGRAKAAAIVEASLKATSLPKAARDFVAEQFREASVGDGMLYTDEQGFKGEVAAQIRAMQKVTDGIVGRSNVRSMGAPAADEVAEPTLRESKEASLLQRLGTEQMPRPRDRDNETGRPAGAAELTESGSTVADRMSARI